MVCPPHNRLKTTLVDGLSVLQVRAQLMCNRVTLLQFVQKSLVKQNNEILQNYNYRNQNAAKISHRNYLSRNSTKALVCKSTVIRFLCYAHSLYISANSFTNTSLQRKIVLTIRTTVRFGYKLLAQHI
jgi:hypothetical protein